MSMIAWLKELGRRLRRPRVIYWSDAALEALRITLRPYNRRGW